jgi:hypothetical protein
MGAATKNMYQKQVGAMPLYTAHWLDLMVPQVPRSAPVGGESMPPDQILDLTQVQIVGSDAGSHT